MYSKILAPIDLAHPDTAKHTISVAKSMAEAGKSDVTVLNVIPDLPSYVAAELPSSIAESVRSNAEQELLKLATDAGIENADHVLIRAGRPHSKILQVADEIGADLIVVASHQPGIEDYLLGSVAAKVVRHAKCTVLVERQRAK